VKGKRKKGGRSFIDALLPVDSVDGKSYQ
jgi:hypothetical protein